MPGTKADYVQSDLGATETTETDLGDITLSGKSAGHIIGVWGCVAKEEATLKEGTLAFFRLASDDVDISPAKFPAVVGGGGTTSTSDSVQMMPMIIPVDIQASPLAKIGCYMVLTIAQAATTVGAVGLIYE